MAERMVAVSVLQLLHADGVIRWARADDIVDVEGEDLERGDRLGYLVPVPEPVEVVIDPDPVENVPASDAEPTAVKKLSRPARTANKDLWIEYAISEGIDRKLAEADETTKADLIALFDED
jgi:hypothetical protein